MKTTFRHAIAILLSVALLAACGDATGPGATIEGSYSLHSVNGQSLPAELWTEEWEGNVYTDVITGGSLTLSNGQFDGTLSSRWYVNGELEGSGTESFGGTYSLSGQTVTYFFSDDGETLSGTFSGNTLTIVVDDDDETAIFSFRRN